MNKENYREVEFYGYSLEECVKKLFEYKEKGQLVYVNFNGHKLFSDTVTLDNAYKEITGETKKEYDNHIKEMYEKHEKEKLEYINSIPQKTKQWIEKGREVLDENKWELWDKIVPIRLNDLYQGMELECCLNIVKILKEGTLEDAKSEIESQGHSGMSFSLVCAMVKEFSVKGEEFVNFIN